MLLSHWQASFWLWVIWKGESSNSETWVATSSCESQQAQARSATLAVKKDALCMCVVCDIICSCLNWRCLVFFWVNFLEYIHGIIRMYIIYGIQLTSTHTYASDLGRINRIKLRLLAPWHRLALLPSIVLSIFTQRVAKPARPGQTEGCRHASGSPLWMGLLGMCSCLDLVQAVLQLDGHRWPYRSAKK